MPYLPVSQHGDSNTSSQVLCQTTLKETVYYALSHQKYLIIFASHFALLKHVSIGVITTI